MTTREQWLRAARRAARELAKRWGIKAPEDIRIEAIAMAEGLRIIEGPLRGARGRLSAGPKPVIRVADDTIHDGARRFTIAHELGHHVLKHPADCHERADASKPVDTSKRDYEAEANAFASELLLPRQLVAPRCHGEPSLEIPRAIALEFTMSIPASAIRYVQLTSERCATVYSHRGAIEWAPKSRGFRTKFARGKPLPSGSMAFDCSRSVDVADRARFVDANVWFETKEKLQIAEHSAPVSETGGVITLLWVPESVAPFLWPRAT